VPVFVEAVGAVCHCDGFEFAVGAGSQMPDEVSDCPVKKTTKMTAITARPPMTPNIKDVELLRRFII
jgi:hypothetical protein